MLRSALEGMTRSPGYPRLPEDDPINPIMGSRWLGRDREFGA
ncbi:MAG: hypothetical protein VKL01_09115 [Limnothrix sp.]|nr:hypothetical protein [Limnothrix sp.]